MFLSKKFKKVKDIQSPKVCVLAKMSRTLYLMKDFYFAFAELDLLLITLMDKYHTISGNLDKVAINRTCCINVLTWSLQQLLLRLKADL